METIEQFLLSHTMCSCNAVEKLIGAPTGTIRLDSSRRIPEKYKQPIIDLISKYGYITDDIVDAPQASIPLPIETVITVTKHDDMFEFTYYRDMIRYMNAKGENNSIRPERTHIYIRCSDIELKDGYQGAFALK